MKDFQSLPETLKLVFKGKHRWRNKNNLHLENHKWKRLIEEFLSFYETMQMVLLL